MKSSMQLVISRMAIAVAVFLWAHAGHAKGTGNLAGRVVDALAGQGIIGAEVRVQNTSLSSATDVDGFFEIADIIPGWRQVSIFAIGFPMMYYDSVLIDSNRTTVLKVDQKFEVAIDGNPPHTGEIRVAQAIEPAMKLTSNQQQDSISLDQNPTENKLPKRDGYKLWTLDLTDPTTSSRSLELVGRMETFGAVSIYSDSRPTTGLPYQSVQVTEVIGRKLQWSKRAQTELYRYEQEGASKKFIAIWDPRPRNYPDIYVPWEWSYRARGSRIQRLTKSLLGKNKILDWVYWDGFNVYSSQISNSLTFAINPIYGYEVWNTDDARGQISRFTSGLRVEGGYRRRLRYMVDFRDHTEAGNGPYTSRDKVFEDRWGAMDLKGNSSTSYNISESFIQYYGQDLSLTAGRGRFQWGPGQFGSLFLNSKQPPFDYVRFAAVLDEDTPGDDALFYTFLHGFLQSSVPSDTLYFSPTGRPRYLNAEKFISGQRLEVRPRGNLLLAMNQAVVYGDRGVQLGYITPLNFLYSVQHSNDDKDNFVLGFDGTYRPFAGLKVYAETFFDDIIVSELTKSSATNKSAYTAGFQGIVPRTFWQNFDLKGEYTKVRPFVYSHFFATNTYTNWYSPLGYTKEPNSEFMTAELRGSFYPWYITLHWSRQNHGANMDSLNAGGDLYVPSTVDAKTAAPFLAGRFEHRDRLGLKLQWEALENLWLFGEGMRVIESRRADRFETHIGFAWNL